jgi:transcription elongation factor Elf1
MKVTTSWACPECQDKLSVTLPCKPTHFKPLFMRIDCVMCESKFQIVINKKPKETNGIEISGEVLIKRGIEMPNYIRERMS